MIISCCQGKRDKIQRCTGVSRQRSHQLTRPNRYNYTRRSTLSRGLGHFWQADLVEFAHDAYSRRINKGVNYLLTVIDLLSRYALRIPQYIKAVLRRDESYKEEK